MLEQHDRHDDWTKHTKKKKKSQIQYKKRLVLKSEIIKVQPKWKLCHPHHFIINLTSIKNQLQLSSCQMYVIVKMTLPLLAFLLFTFHSNCLKKQWSGSLCYLNAPICSVTERIFIEEQHFICKACTWWLFPSESVAHIPKLPLMIAQSGESKRNVPTHLWDAILQSTPFVLSCSVLKGCSGRMTVVVPLSYTRKSYFMTECGGWVNESRSLGREAALYVGGMAEDSSVRTVAGMAVLFFWYPFGS